MVIRPAVPRPPVPAAVVPARESSTSSSAASTHTSTSARAPGLSEPAVFRYSPSTPTRIAPHNQREREHRSRPCHHARYREPGPPLPPARRPQISHQHRAPRPERVRARTLAQRELQLIQLGRPAARGVHQRPPRRVTHHRQPAPSTPATAAATSHASSADTGPPRAPARSATNPTAGYAARQPCPVTCSGILRPATRPTTSGITPASARPATHDRDQAGVQPAGPANHNQTTRPRSPYLCPNHSLARDAGGRTQAPGCSLRASSW